MTRDTYTQADVRALVGQPGAKRSKYNARRTWLEEAGRWFDSAHEAQVAAGLLLRERVGEVRNIRYQVRYPLVVNGCKVCVYVSDFVYEEGGRPSDLWWEVVADAKSAPTRTPVYRLKAKLMRACLGIEIVEL